MGLWRAVLEVEYDDRQGLGERPPIYWERLLRDGQSERRPDIINVRVEVRETTVA